MSKYEEARTQLLQRLEHLTQRVGLIEEDLRKPHDPDWQERAIQLENDEVLEGLDEMSRKEVQQILEALRRIDTGGYGTCVSCGRPIGQERMAALPSTLTCVRCA
jgi:RNA polymerase-binding transcription factor DksA